MITYNGIYDSKVYPKEAVLKAAFAFIDDYYIHIGLVSDMYQIDFTPKEENKADTIIGQFENELLAATVRLQIYQQTHVLREIMLGRAMASTMIMEDSVDLSEKEESDNEALGDILKDWFEHE